MFWALLYLSSSAAEAIGSTKSEIVSPVDLSQVTLINDGNAFKDAQDLNTRYLNYLEPDRLLFQFRFYAGLANKVEPYGGWESPDYVEGLINGHFTGHLLSAYAFSIAGHTDPDGALLKNAIYITDQLQLCQHTIAKKTPYLAGYVSAYDVSQIERLEAHNTTQVWAPYYTLHKIMAGLLDQHIHVPANKNALAVVEGLASFIKKRVDAIIKLKGKAWWETCLDAEFGGMNEVAFSLYGLTKNPDHLVLAGYFYKQKFMDPLAANQDPLNGAHANTHLPEVVGVARGWEVTGNKTLHDIAENFYTILGANYTYSTGGSNVNEHWSSPDQLGDAIATSFDKDANTTTNSNGYHTQETCSTYNALKVARHLFLWNPSSIALLDDYERKLLNGIMGVQNTAQIGSLSYMTPLGIGVTRTKYDWWGFGQANNSFWCCYGTTIESFAKLGDSVFFEAVGGKVGPTLTVAQYIPSQLDWAAGGLKLSMARAISTSTTAGAAITVTVTVRSAVGDAAGDAAIQLRVPQWAAKGSFMAVGGGSAVPVMPGTFVKARPGGDAAGWSAGDKIVLVLAMAPRLEPIRDHREAYSTMYSILLGPYVMAGLTHHPYQIAQHAGDVEKWVLPSHDAKGEAALQAYSADGFQLRPLNTIQDESYTVYFNITADAVV